MRRLVVAGALLALVAAGCTGGSSDDDGSGPSLPLPSKAPSTRGPASGPALEAKVLLASSDELEQQAGSIDEAQVERRSGAFISGRTVVGYSVDDISGYDLETGEQSWRSQLDLEGGTVCFVSEPDRAVKTFTVVYGDGGYCPRLATIRVSDGKVLKKSAKLDETTEFKGANGGGTVNHLFTVKGRDYLVDFHGVVWKMVKGEPVPTAVLEDRTYFTLYPTPQGDMLIGSRLSDRPRCRVDGYALPSFEHRWTEDTKSLFPEVREDCVISAAPGNSALLTQQASESNTYFMTQVDPQTGKVVGRADGPVDGGGKAPEGELDVASAANQLDQAFGLPGGDTIFAQVRGLTRYSVKTGKVAWDLGLGQLQLDSDEDYPLTTVLPQGVTRDGYLVATVSNDTAVEVVAVDVKTGRLRGRWAVPDEYRNGFQVDPGLTLFDDGVVLTRNFEDYSRTFVDYREIKKPTGDLYDIGVFTFPEPGSSRPASVPTTGPVDTETKVLGGIRTPDDAADTRYAGVFSTGQQVVAYSGGTVTGRDPRTGKQRWSLEVDEDDADARVCVAPTPDQAVKTFTIAVRGGGEKDTCSTLLRVNAATGAVMDRVEVPASAKTVARIIVDQRVVHVVTGDRRVSRLRDGALVEESRLAHQPYQVERTPEDPSLVITTSSLKGGRDWAVDAYRLPSFEPVWSTTASAVLGKVDRRNWVVAWRGNGLWLSTSYGDLSDPEAKVKESLVSLDPRTGRVTARTGVVKRDFLADDLAKFSLTGAASSSFQSVGFDGGDVVVSQEKGLMRYSLQDRRIRWATDISSIKGSMEEDRLATSVTDDMDLIDGGRTILVTLSNNVSVELMTLDAASGKITGRWNVPQKARNGLQASPEVVPFSGGVALARDDYSWDYAFAQSGRTVPSDPQYDVGLFALPKPKK